MKKFIFILIVLFIVGCSSSSDVDQRKYTQKWADSYVNLQAISYVKDERTNICFAVSSAKGHGKGMATVPCKKAEKYIIRRIK